MTAPGDLSHRLVLEQPVDTPDGAGGMVRSFATVTTLWASVTSVSARNDVVASQSGATVTHQIIIRAGRNVTTQHRFRDGARIFRILSVREQPGRFLDIRVEERTT